LAPGDEPIKAALDASIIDPGALGVRKFLRPEYLTSSIKTFADLFKKRASQWFSLKISEVVDEE